MRRQTERRPIPGFPGYEASSAGSILRAGRRIRGSVHHHGHLRVCLAGARKAFVHVLVALAFHGRPRRRNAVVRHLDGNPKNNRPSNLRWGTEPQNLADMRRHGRRIGVRPKLSAAQVRRAARLSSRFSSRVIGERLGVHHTTILRALRGQR